ncbi:hypothetical protein DICPUDRAFT_88397 [Dictyostelium purpureum]|uniref:CARMIL pleckstrin homology domain-containing protein n=1 Tax=Dictyostelium purpureum TaxID=5786 RepID=F0ZP52_DICPU|nr:uncharacterized protein DICPUDRAFT_88397 [Dictyostelium purpureum]EGC34266.1 hypothetical protein DICPUDRAFT_88397 [Dictyostelium purpureum]|eukprot:XP_003289195.1 hypothetical protein DICPUDRAFT_88397 [Dictyostelium purpureum]
MEILTQAERKNIDIYLQQKNEDENYLQRVEVKGKKARKLFFIIGNNRVFFFKVGGKIEIDYHFLDILELKSDGIKEIQLKFRNDGGKEPLIFGLEQESDSAEIILAIDYLFTLNFPSMQNNRLKIIVPEPKRTEIYSSPNALIPEVGVCNGFTQTYFSLCDYLNIQPISEVSWHIENVIGDKSDIKDFDYGFFFKKDRIITIDAKPIMQALTINKYFTSFSVNNIKLSNECIQSIIQLVSQNTCFEKICLNGIGLDRSATEKLIESFNTNKALKLKELDLGNNNIEDKGMTLLSEYLKTTHWELSTLILNNCSAGRSAMAHLGDAITFNENILRNLKYLDVASNRLESDGSVAFSKLLERSKTLQTFLISNCNPQFHQWTKVCISLNKFDNSGNRITRKDNIHRDMISFLNHSIYLNNLNLSKCQIPVEAVADIFGEGNLVKMETLNVSDNDLGDEGISTLCDLMANHPSIRSLNISGNFNRRSKNRTNAIESIINMLEKKSKTHNSIRSLSIQGSGKSQLKGDLLPIVCSIFYNGSLKELDISGHSSGDIFAASVGKLLQCNAGLETLYLDDNSITSRGLQLIKFGLARNSTLTRLPLPIKDIASALKADATPVNLQKITEVSTEIQQIILDNYTNRTIQSNTSLRDSQPKQILTKSRASSTPIVNDPKATVATCAGLKSFISIDTEVNEPLANANLIVN